MYWNGQLPEWPNGADCNSAGFRLRWFESITAHKKDLKENLSSLFCFRFTDHTEILRGKNRILVAVKKIKEMSYDQFLRFIFPERECLIILSCLISKKSRIG